MPAACVVIRSSNLVLAVVVLLDSGAMAEFQGQLSELLGRRINVIRKTDETPTRISVIDVAIAITGKSVSNAARDIGFVKERYPDLAQKLGDVKFTDAGGRRFR